MENNRSFWSIIKYAGVHLHLKDVNRNDKSNDSHEYAASQTSSPLGPNIFLAGMKMLKYHNVIFINQWHNFLISMLDFGASNRVGNCILPVSRMEIAFCNKNQSCVNMVQQILRYWTKNFYLNISLISHLKWQMRLLANLSLGITMSLKPHEWVKALITGRNEVGPR